MAAIDVWMPAYDFSERHETLVRAPVRAVHRALHELDLGRLPLVRTLMALRALPALVLSPRATLRRRGREGAPRRATRMPVDGFAVLCDGPSELVLGLTGRFWKLAGAVVPTEVGSFREALPPGVARVAFNFLLTEESDGTTRLATETRIRCADPEVRRRFAWYWRIIRPGSGLIRRAMLRAIRRAAEASA